MRPNGTLTRRGRLTRTAIGFAVLAGGVLLGPGALADGPAEPVVADTFTVAEGETLWEIAAIVAPDAPVDRTVAEILRLNGMTSAGVRAGQQILVPVAP